jgi:branched-chain amino acid transport system substrate-binding protein
MRTASPASTEKPNPLWRLNLPPELAVKAAWYVAGLGLAAMVLLGAACSYMRATQAPPTVKIGLVAPFEGEYRSTGYEVLFAVKLALQQYNQRQGSNGYRVELVALNDFNDPTEARRQAEALVTDPDVVGVIGHLTASSTIAALPVYRAAGLAVVSPWSIAPSVLADEAAGVVSIAATTAETQAKLAEVQQAAGIGSPVTLTALPSAAQLPLANQAVTIDADAVTAGNILLSLAATGHLSARFGQVETGNRQLVQVAGPAADGFVFVSPGPDAGGIKAPGGFMEAYQALAGLPPGPRAVLAYDATHVLLNAIEQISNRWYNNCPERAEIFHIIPQTHISGLSGEISFTPGGQRRNAPVWVYQISETRYPGKPVDH